MTTRVYTSKSCQPCQELKARIQDGQIDGQPVEIVDIETDEGFELFSAEVMSKATVGELLSVPSAYQDGKRCLITVEQDEVHLDCGEAQVLDTEALSNP